MACSFNGTTNEYHGAGVIQQQPVTIAAWFNSTNTTAEQFIAGVQFGATRTGHFLVARGNSAGDPVSARTRTGAGAAYANTATGYSSGVWHHGCAVFASATSRTAYIDGGNSGTNTTSRDPSSVTPQVEIGAAVDAGDMFFTGHIADIGIWDVALTAEEVAQLAKGFSPLIIRPQSLIHYHALIRGSQALDFRRNVIVTGSSGAATVNHPSVFMPRR